MSGHSKWATTKHKKAIIDSRRAKVFAKQIRAIEVAARNGGADMDGNPTLFDAVAKAKKSSMPSDNIERAIKRGAGLEAGAKDWITIMYEGYGPNGVAIMIECLSDNRNRSASEVKVAVTRNGGADMDGNPTLFDAVAKAKKSSMPSDNIDRAIKRGAGLEAGAKDWITIMYEGYGPNGVAIMIECLSDNRNRSASEVKVAVTRNGGSMADLGSVSYLFNRKGVVIVKKDGTLTEDSILDAVLEAGAEEVNDLGEAFEIVSEPVDLVPVRTALQSAGIDYESADSSFLPSMSIPLDADGAKKVFELIDAIEELDDVQNVYSNFDVSDEVMASLE